MKFSHTADAVLPRSITNLTLSKLIGTDYGAVQRESFVFTDLIFHTNTIFTERIFDINHIVQTGRSRLLLMAFCFLRTESLVTILSGVAVFTSSSKVLKIPYYNMTVTVIFMPQNIILRN